MAESDHQIEAAPVTDASLKEAAFAAASTRSRDSLKTIAYSDMVRDLSRLSLPEIDSLIDEISQSAPAGDALGVILNGLTRLSGRRLSQNAVKQDINFLFKSVKNNLDRAVYGTFFAGPAAIIWAYQRMLQLAGKSPDDAFPEGPWQFYVNYALREDSARHSHETHGFDSTLAAHDIQPAPLDRLTAWCMAAIHTLHQYDELLANEWRERVYIRVLQQVIGNTPYKTAFAHIFRQWEKLRPFRRGPDADPNHTFVDYRRHKFDSFLESRLKQLPQDVQRHWIREVRSIRETSLPAYQRQMSLLAYLNAEQHGEVRQEIPLAEAHIGLIFRGHYYLIPACQPNSERPPDAAVVRAQIAAILDRPDDSPGPGLSRLASVRRAHLRPLRESFTPTQLAEWQALRSAPILINADQRPRQLPLAAIRRTERGIGDHPLTLFDTGQTMVFDQSHIFFDGAWGAALAEIMTNEALSWLVHLRQLPDEAITVNAPRQLRFDWQPAAIAAIEAAPRNPVEVSAESDAVNLKAMLGLRQLFKRRSDLLQLTVNDLLVLYRAIHAVTYRPAPELTARLEELAADPATQAAAKSALAAIDPAGQRIPAILIPIDATQRSPRDRLYPMCFDVPLPELDLIRLHREVLDSFHEHAASYNMPRYHEFDDLQRRYLAMLAGFAQVFGRARDYATRGESASVGTIRLLAYMPTAWQRFLDKIPQQFDILNDLIKGQEVLSNLGRVAAGSSLTRFITAKDDNDKKTLTWGVLTDDRQIMHITLRDFRPHVQALRDAGQEAAARMIVEDYLRAYVRGLNDYVRDLRRITIASRDSYSGR